MCVPWSSQFTPIGVVRGTTSLMAGHEDLTVQDKFTQCIHSQMYIAKCTLITPHSSDVHIMALSVVSVTLVRGILHAEQYVSEYIGWIPGLMNFHLGCLQVCCDSPDQARMRKYNHRAPVATCLRLRASPGLQS